MNIKQSIEWLNLKRKCDDRVFQESIIERHQKIDDVVKHLQILEEIEEMFTPGKIFYICKNKNFEHHAQQIMDLKYIVDEIKQKYFPELIKKTIKIEIEAKDIDGMAFGIKTIGHIISDISGNKNIPKMKIIDIGKMKVDKE